MDDSWYPPELDYNLPEDNDFIFTLTLEIRSMMLEMDRYKNNSSLTNEQKRSKIREVRQSIMRTYGEIERERRRPTLNVYNGLQRLLSLPLLAHIPRAKRNAGHDRSKRELDFNDDGRCRCCSLSI